MYEKGDSESESESSSNEFETLSMDEIEDLVADNLTGILPDVIPYRFVPTQERSYEKLLGLKPQSMISRRDSNRSKKENLALSRYRKEAGHIFYMKLRNDISGFVGIA